MSLRKLPSEHGEVSVIYPNDAVAVAPPPSRTNQRAATSGGTL